MPLMTAAPPATPGLPLPSARMPEPVPPTHGYWRQLPNAITVSRVLLAGSFFAVLTPWRFDRSPLAQGHSPDRVLLLAAALFILAAITDAIDGYLARRWGAVTTFGRIMDPFADKLLVIGGFVYLAGPGFVAARFKPLGDNWGTASLTAVQAWMVAVILGRELLVTSIRAVLESDGVHFPATTSGKLKMILQSVCVPAVLILLNFPNAWHDDATPGAAGRAIQILVWTTVLVTLWSGVPYVARAAAAARGDAGALSHPAKSGLSAVGQLLITSFGLGFLRPASGTWGSLPTVILAGLLIAGGIGPADQPVAFSLIMAAVVLVFTAICVLYGDAAEARFLRKDPSQVVADETAGQAIALLALPASAVATPGRTAITLVLAFVLFRIMDILKPPPARGIQSVPGGWGIVLDDLVAGFYALVVLQFVTRVLM
jgi:phosphatidylglycerophosphate synthase/phosphatidylglycerophosphatase A